MGLLQSPFAMKVLSCFMQEFNFAGQRIDKSLRKLLKKVRVPGEAQKIEKIMEIFGKRYARCNPNFVSKLKSPDSIVTLAFAIILLNTDLHTPNLKSENITSCVLCISLFFQEDETAWIDGVSGCGGGFEPVPFHPI